MLTTAENETATTGDGIGLRSGGFEPSRSPPARGTLPITETEGAWFRVIPAWAGNTLTSRQPTIRPSGHPRVGGEHTSQS